LLGEAVVTVDLVLLEAVVAELRHWLEQIQQIRKLVQRVVVAVRHLLVVQEVGPEALRDRN
jgi:hypothetical protein